MTQGKRGRENRRLWRSLGAVTLLPRLGTLNDRTRAMMEDSDPENLHQARVACRRLRSALTAFDEVLPKALQRISIREVRALLRALGSARDGDVQILHIGDFLADAPHPARPGLERVLLRLRQRRAAMQPTVVNALDRFHSAGLAERMGEKLENAALGAPLEGDALPAPLARRARKILAPRIDDLRRLTSAACGSSADHTGALHAARIAAKRLRYTLEMLVPFADEGEISVIGDVTRLQSILGEVHDADVWLSLLPELQEEERLRTLDYLGSTDGFDLLLPGFVSLTVHWQTIRTSSFTRWLTLMNEFDVRGVWTQLDSTFTYRKDATK